LSAAPRDVTPLARVGYAAGMSDRYASTTIGHDILMPFLTVLLCAPVALLGWQALEWLRFGFWPAVSLADVLNAMDRSIVPQLLAGSWVGMNKALAVMLQAWAGFYPLAASFVLMKLF
jgi:hypothetical protein